MGLQESQAGLSHEGVTQLEPRSRHSGHQHVLLGATPQPRPALSPKVIRTPTPFTLSLCPPLVPQSLFSATDETDEGEWWSQGRPALVSFSHTSSLSLNGRGMILYIVEKVNTEVILNKPAPDQTITDATACPAKIS